MTVSDHISEYLLGKGYEHVFGLTGGGIARMFDSASRYLKPIYSLHEQSASMAAVAYSMIKDNKGLCFCTTGPGGTNTLTGLLGAWQDSTPCLFFSGQARSNQLAYSRGIRQGAVQDFNILDIVKSMTKYSKLLLESDQVEYIVDRAIYASQEGRPGPSWIDIPIDVQWKDTSDKQYTFSPNESYSKEENNLIGNVDRVIELLSSSKRPVILLGYGCRLAGITNKVVEIAREFRIPIVTTWNTMDAMDSSDPMYLGVVGTMGGRRGANMAMCNSDLLLALGSRLPVTVTGNLDNPFSKDTIVVCVNNDINELNYRGGVVDIPICGDVRDFLATCAGRFVRSDDNWISTIAKYKELNSVCIDHSTSNKSVNPYIWGSNLSEELDKDDTLVIDGGGTTLSVSYGSLNLRGQRAINMAGIACMGTGLPMAIGAHYASSNRVIVISGDGSIMLNIHDLATISESNLPIKIFIQDNSGYLAIRNTQDMYFQGNYQGSASSGGLKLPSLKRIIEGFGIPVWVASDNNSADVITNTIMSNIDGPAACILQVDYKQKIYPTPNMVFDSSGKSTTSKLSNMYPDIDNII